MREIMYRYGPAKGEQVKHLPPLETEGKIIPYQNLHHKSLKYERQKLNQYKAKYSSSLNCQAMPSTGFNYSHSSALDFVRAYGTQTTRTGG